MCKNFFICVLMVLAASSSQADNLSAFNRILNENNMQFAMPNGFSPVKVVENEDVAYQYAVKSKKVKLEIRYSVFSLKEHLKEYEEFKKKKNGVMIDPNSLPSYYGMTIAVVMNIAGTEKFNETVFPPETVKAEFNADWGASYLVESNSGFGKGYKYALIVALHKNNEADAYTVFLFDDFKKIQGEMLAAFYCMKFKF